MGVDYHRLSKRAELYYALAEALAEMPSWLVRAGSEWPLTQAARKVMPGSLVVEKLAGIPAESKPHRQNRYTRLFRGPGRPRFWLYESMWRSGRFLGPESLSLEKLYTEAGLQVNGAEAADHASVELAFLSHLTECQLYEPGSASLWKRIEQSFIKQHAGHWLPALGRSLARSGDEVYGVIGELMAEFLLESEHPKLPTRSTKMGHCLPTITNQETCNLCGFCVQICPKRALAINETPYETSLSLSIADCNGCRKCSQVCPAGVISILNQDDYLVDGPQQELRRSPRVICPGCGEATVSRAEFDFVVEQIGRPAWLTYCLPCRSELVEK